LGSYKNRQNEGPKTKHINSQNEGFKYFDFTTDYFPSDFILVFDTHTPHLGNKRHVSNTICYVLSLFGIYIQIPKDIPRIITR